MKTPRMMFLLALAVLVLGMAPDAVTGRWRTQVQDGVVAISLCGGSICGTLLSSAILDAHPGLLDARNENPGLRGRTLRGVLMLQGFVSTADGWTGGTIYDPEDGRTYHARVSLLDADHLRVRGCVFFPLCRSQVWTRVE